IGDPRLYDPADQGGGEDRGFEARDQGRHVLRRAAVRERRRFGRRRHPDRSRRLSEALTRKAGMPKPPADRGRPTVRKRAMIVIVGLLIAVVTIGAGATVLLVTADLRPLIERYARTSLHRRLAIGALRIGWGNPL